MQDLVDQLDAALPQTQCGECDFSGCRPYAEALARGNAEIDRCPPGGVETLQQLASLLNLNAEPYQAKLTASYRAPSVAVVREAECIGCTKCIQACPVDAILGAAKHMHTVIQSECTGCGLCVEPCPVDCIDINELEKISYDKDLARERYRARQQRLSSLQAIKDDKHSRAKQFTASKSQDKSAKQDYIKQALARTQQKPNNE